MLVTEGPDAVRELISLGTVFDQTEAGELSLTREGGHHRDRIAHAGGDATGAEIQRALVAAVRAAPDIDVTEHALVLDLVPGADGGVAGVTLHVMGEGQRDGVGAVLCRAVVLASGGLGQVFSATTNPSVSTGDGMALALRAGAVLRDLEFVQFHPTVMWLGAGSTGQQPLISEAVRGEGAFLVDDAGERFMLGQHELADLAPRDVVAKAIMRRMRETGAEHVWLDARGFGAEKWERRFPTILATCRSHGVDPVTELIPVGPACHYASGGVATDLHGQSSVPGLFACGEVACSGVHGANRLASNSLLEGLVFSRRIAAHLAAGLPPRQRAGRRPAAGRAGGRRRARRAAARDDRDRRGAAVRGRALRRRRRARPPRHAYDGRGRRRGLGDDQPAHGQHRPGRRRGDARGDPRVALARGLPGARRRALGPARRRRARRRAPPARPLTRPHRSPRVTSTDPTTALDRELAEAGLDPRAVSAAVAAAVAEDLPGEDVTSAATLDPRTDRVGRPRRPRRRRGGRPGRRRAGLPHRRGRRRRGASGRPPTGTGSTRGDVLLSVHGPVPALLTAERTALNFLCHLSGVATATSRWVDALAGTGARVRDTRKTTPGFRALEKYAVRCGGGLNHRATLSDQALVKDNHVLAAGGVVPAYRAVRERYPDLPVQVEVTTLDQLRELLDVGAPEILLDNMSHRADGRGGPGHRRPGPARGLRRAHPRAGPRGRLDRGRPDRGRRDHALRAGARRRDGPPAGPVTAP